MNRAISDEAQTLVEGNSDAFLLVEHVHCGADVVSDETLGIHPAFTGAPIVIDDISVAEMTDRQSGR